MTMPTGHKPRRAGGPVKVGDVIQCQCGKCGLSFVMEDIRFANRRYHPDCPVRVRKAQMPHEAKRAAEERRVARLASQAKKICDECCDLPHRRPPKGCKACKLPYGEAPAASMSLLSCSPIASRCVLIMLLMGCASDPGLDYTPPCDLTFAPDGAHDDVIQAAADRLHQATGAGYSVGECGWRVRFEDVVIGEDDGAPLCGETRTTTVGDEVIGVVIRLSSNPPTGCISTESTLMHEAIHATWRFAQHANKGLFAKEATSEYLFGESLNILCDALGYCPIREDERP